MSEGLGHLQHVVVKQEFDPLEYCVPVLPCPSKVGLPCLPCDRANTFHVVQSNQHFDQLGMKALEVQEQTSLLDRLLCCPSHRAFSLLFEDFYGNTPFSATKNRKLPFFNSQVLTLHREGTLLGTIEQRQTCIQFQKGLYEDITISGADGQLLFTITSELRQCGHCCILPCQACRQVDYQVLHCKSNFRDGFIRHVMASPYVEMCSKSDEYHVQFPRRASEDEKVLLVTTALFIDYLNYENV